MDLQAELDRLYSLPLDEFTAARNEIAKNADGDDAKAIRALKKPSVGAWAINQLARKHSDDVRELLAVRDELEHASSPGSMRELSNKRRTLVARLTKSAKTVLEEGGHGSSQSTLEKVSQGLLAGGTDEERADLEKGRLTREPSSSGLEALGFGADAAAEEETTPQVSLKTQREVQKLRREAERLQQESARLEQEAAFAEEQARRARSKADEAAAAADEARERAIAAAEEAGID
jgi:hypothetical protein